jgi:transcriptional regulator with XRE-family HTH domain
MPAMVASPVANHLAVEALFAAGKTARQIAETLGMDRSTVWRMRHASLVDPALIQHVSKSLADKALLGANAAVDEFLDKAENGDLANESPIALAKAASVLMQSAGAYAALSGAKDTLSQFVDEFGLAPTHTASKLTLTKTVTIEQSQNNEPQIINGL